jgi:hypothetical protein
MPRRHMMNDQKKLKLSKETLRCLDDDVLTDVVGGGHGRDHGGGGNNSFDCNNSNGCQGSGICISAECNSFVCSVALFC